MKKVALFLADGFEEIEALTVVDLLRRAEIPVDTVSVTGNLAVTGAHDVQVKADMLFEDFKKDDYQMLVTPGGLEGSQTLAGFKGLLDLVEEFSRRDKRFIACICASPMVLEAAGVAGNYVGTIYPGMESEVNYKEHSEDDVVKDKNLITAKGPATAMSFALEIINTLLGEEKRREIAEGLLFK